MMKNLEENFFYSALNFKSPKKMIKNIITIFLSLIIFFIVPNIAFAASNNKQPENIIRIDTEQINQDIFQISRTTESQDLRGNNYSPYPDFVWVASLILPGLGQLLMGDSSGLVYIIIFAALIPLTLSVHKLNNSSGENFAIIFTYLFELILIIFLTTFYFINVGHAYYENKDKVKEYKKKMKVIIGFIEKIQISDNSISLQAISF